MSRTIAMEVPEIALGERWVITKAGTEGAWLPGWFAYAPHADSGAWFPTYDEARLFVASQVDQAVERARFADSLARWGVDRQQRAQGGGRPTEKESHSRADRRRAHRDQGPAHDRHERRSDRESDWAIAAHSVPLPPPMGVVSR